MFVRCSFIFLVLAWTLPASSLTLVQDQPLHLAWPGTDTLECAPHIEGPWHVCAAGRGLPNATNELITATDQGRPRLFFRTAPGPSGRGQLISSTKLTSITKSQLSLLLQLGGLAGFDVEYDVDLYKVTYQTASVDGRNSTIASGAIAIPINAVQPVPLAAYQHGTVSLRTSVPSNFSTDNLEVFAPIIMAAAGYAAVAADYLGLGDEPGFHPYAVVRPTAISVIDLLRAARPFLSDHGMSVNDQLFLVGYSQGGQATLAVHRELEAHYQSEFTVTASAPMAGAYDLSGTMLSQFLSGEPHPEPSLWAYAILGYTSVYPELPRPESIFAEPYLSDVVPLFDGQHALDELSAQLPAVPREMLQPSFLHDLEENRLHPFRLALRDNDLINWSPAAPIRFFHCRSDQTVPFENSQLAHQTLSSNSTAEITLIDPKSEADHTDCILPSFLAAKTWINTLRTSTSP